MLMSVSSFPSDLFRRIASEFPRGSIFFAEDLEFLGRDPLEIRWALSTLSKDGTSLVRLARGVFCYPRLDEHAKLMLPDDVTVAEALARRWRVRIAPCAEQAAYLAGLIPLQLNPLKFVSDGSFQQFNLQNGRQIVFMRRKSNKVFYFRSEKLRNLVEGLRFLGPENITDHVIGVVRRTLPEISASDFNHDILLAPGWVRNVLIGECSG